VNAIALSAAQRLTGIALVLGFAVVQKLWPSSSHSSCPSGGVGRADEPEWTRVPDAAICLQ
jgi:hypothetical protein